MSVILGIDIGVGTTKIVSLNGDGRGNAMLESIGEAKTPGDAWIKGDQKKMAELAAVIKSLMNDLKIRSRKAVVSLPEDQVVSRVIRLPPLKGGEIRDALKFEAETFVPYPLDQVSIDYEVIEQDDSSRLTVFVIAAKNDLINLYIRLAKMCGLELLAIESPAVSIKRLVNSAIGTSLSTMVVDMGEAYSNIICLDKGNIGFTRTVSVGGESLTRAVSINLGLDMASAEEYKKAYGLKEMELEGKVKAALSTVFGSMAEEIRRAMVSFSEDQGHSIELLILSGGGANIPGLAEELTRILGVEVQVIQPFIKTDTSRMLPSSINLASDGCRFSLAVGLALRDVVK